VKIIFLDIDGVLNSHGPITPGTATIRPVNVSHLNHILQSVPESRIILSTAWRYLILNGSMTVKGFEEALISHGIACRERISGFTCSDEQTLFLTFGINDTDYANRAQYHELLKDKGYEIRAHQIHHSLTFIPRTVEAFAVLDDMPVPIENLVQTDPQIGLTREDAERVIAILMAERKQLNDR
jgi:hypothetical protein